jgi:hypothetical protein
MQVKTIQEVYDWTVLFHTQMAANFFSLRDDLAEHNQMLADYFVKYEKKLAEDLVGFKAITEINIFINTYLVVQKRQQVKRNYLNCWSLNIKD